MLRRRLQLVTLSLIVSLCLGVGTASAAEFMFRDIDNHWAKTTIEWGVEKGIVKGYANGMFMPNQNVTEAEFIRMLVVGITGKDLEDNFLTDRWSDKYYNFLHFKNYPVVGFADLKLRDKPITRLQVAEMITSADGVHYTSDQAIQYVLGKMYALGRVKGENTIQSFMGSATITRAEVLQIIKNLTDHGMSQLYDRPEEPSSQARLPKLPTAWDIYRDEMHMVIRKKVYPNYSGYRLYDDGISKIIMTNTLQQGQTDNAVSVQFEQQIQSFSAVSISNSTDSTQRKMMLEVLNLFGFKADAAFLNTVDEAEKQKKVLEVEVSGKTLIIDPQISSPAGHVTVTYKWWDDARS